MSRLELLAWVWQHDRRGRTILLLAGTGFLGLVVTTAAFLTTAENLPHVLLWNQLTALGLSVVALALVTRSVLRRARADVDRAS
jgi:hypothetical protein